MAPVPTPFATTFSGDDVLLLLFYGLVVVYVIFTAILYYHWQTYSTDPKMNFLTFVIYFATTVPLIIILAAMVAL